MAARVLQSAALGWNHLGYLVLRGGRRGILGVVGAAWVLLDRVGCWVDGAFKGRLVEHVGVRIGWIGDILGVRVLRGHGGHLIRK